MIGLRNGSSGFPAFLRASLIRAQKPAQTGALQLVPPSWDTCPWKTREAPLSGSAVTLTSGTSRSLPGGTPAPVCQTGRGNRELLPPPLPVQAISPVTEPLGASVRLVPPTPITGRIGRLIGKTRQQTAAGQSHPNSGNLIARLYVQRSHETAVHPDAGSSRAAVLQRLTG